VFGATLSLPVMVAFIESLDDSLSLIGSC
jgi:hypothetical protein